MSWQDFGMDGIEEAAKAREIDWRARCLAAEAERDALKGRAVYSYCGNETLRSVGTHEQFLEAITTHVFTCDKRPEVAMAIKLAEVEQERDQYKRESDALRGIEAQLKQDGEGIWLSVRHAFFHREIPLLEAVENAMKAQQTMSEERGF